MSKKLIDTCFVNETHNESNVKVLGILSNKL